MRGEELAPGELAAIGLRMLVDRSTVDVVGALRSGGVEPVLLKGPVVARWLYDGPGERPYSDIDLLVAPADQEASAGILRDLGYEARLDRPLDVPLVGRSAPHATTWVAADAGVAVDLHRCLHETEHLPDQQVWDEVWRDHTEVEVGGVAIPAPAPRVRALHVVLHLQPKDVPGSRAWTDLERAVARVEPAVWSDAADLAGRFGLRAEMGALLALVPGGAELARSLGLTTAPPVHLAQQHRRHAPALARLQLRTRGAGVVGTARIVAAKASPHRVRAVASRSDAGLAQAYGEQLRRLPRLVRDWVRYRRSGSGQLR